MSSKPAISFDDSTQLRILDDEVARHTESLADDCEAFENKTHQLLTSVQSLLQRRAAQCDQVNRVKLMAIIQRNRLENEKDTRNRMQLELEQQLSLRQSELDRLTEEVAALQLIEIDQSALIQNVTRNTGAKTDTPR